MREPFAVAELETPALVIDLDQVERNIARVADYAREQRLPLIARGCVR